MFLFVTVLSLVASAAEPAAADKKPDPPTVKVGGIVFAHYDYDLTDGADGYNEFALDRAYLTIQATLNPHLATKLTLDGDRFKSTTLSDDSTVNVDTKYRVFVKHAYLEGRWDEPGLKVRGGIVDTPYCPFYDGFVGVRYITESFAKQNKVLDTADLGVGVWGKQFDGLVDWNVSLLNGEGYGKPEVDKGKAVQGRVSIDPLAKGKKMNLPITAFVSYNGQPATEAPIVTMIGAVGFKQDYLVGWGEVLRVSNDEVVGEGYSATLVPRVPKFGGVLLRYDHFDRNADTEDDASTTLIAGATHDFFERVSLAGTFERTSKEGSDTPTQGVFVHMQAGF